MLEFNRFKTYLQSGIPERFWKFDLSHICDEFYKKNKTVLGALNVWMDELGTSALSGAGILIWSRDHGTAKSALAALIEKKGIDIGLRVSWYSGTALYDILLQDSGFDRSRVLDDIDNTDLLILDEVDKIYIPEGERKVVRARVCEFFNRFYEQLVTTVATANCQVGDLQALYPSTLIDRMLEWDELHLAGIDYRQKQSRLQELLDAKKKG